MLREFDASGSLLRSSTLASLSGNQSSWTQLVGTATTGASCAYVDLALRALDTTSASANGTIYDLAGQRATLEQDATVRDVQYALV